MIIVFNQEDLKWKYKTAAGVTNGDIATIFSAIDDFILKVECNPDCRAISSMWYNKDYLPIQMFSDKTSNVYMIARNASATSQDLFIAPIHKSGLVLEQQSLVLDKNASSVENVIVAAFAKLDYVYFVYEYRHKGIFDADDRTKRHAVITKVKVTTTDEHYEYSVVGHRYLHYYGMITSYTDDESYAYFVTTGASIVRIRLDTIGKTSTYEPEIVFEDSNSMIKFNALALSQDSKILIATSESGIIVKINLESM
jgi:hypothetical protein